MWKVYSTTLNLQGDTTPLQRYPAALDASVFATNLLIQGDTVFAAAATLSTMGSFLTTAGGILLGGSDTIKMIGNDTISTQFMGIAPTFDGGYLLGGKIRTDFQYPYWVKTDGQGNKQWEKADLASPYSFVYSILPAADSSGYYLLTAYNWQYDDMTVQTRLSKIDMAGNVLWHKNYTFDNPYYLGILDVMQKFFYAHKGCYF